MNQDFYALRILVIGAETGKVALSEKPDDFLLFFVYRQGSSLIRGKKMIVKPVHILIAFVVFAQGSAVAQLLPSPPHPALQSEIPMAKPGLPSASAFHGGAIGLAPADPLATELYRADPKLYASFDLNPLFGIETTFVNALHREGMQYLGMGPRLGQGVPLGFSGPRPEQGAPRGVGGFDLDLVARLTIPVDDRLSAFGKLGASASTRRYHATSASSTAIGTAASVGVTYKLGNGQTITAEAPLGAMGRKAISGVDGGHGARLKLGF